MDPKAFYNDTMPGKLGADYEHARWHSNAFQEAQYNMMSAVMAERVMPVTAQAKRVLEIGPGAGTWTKFLLNANKNAQYTLVDISAEMLARAKASLPNGLPISFQESDILAYESGEKFDVIFSSRALEYMPDKKTIAQKFSSLLSPGGTLILITKMPKDFLDSLSGRELSALHKGQITPRELSVLLAGAGLRNIRTRIATATVPGVKSPFLNRLAFSLFSKVPLVRGLSIFAESYVITAQKGL